MDIDSDGKWKTVFEAHCIGHKRIICLDKNVKRVRLNITESADMPIIKEMTLA